MSNSTKIIVSVLLFSFASASAAFALYKNNVRVDYVRTYGNSDRVDIWFDQDVTSGCSNNDVVSVTSSYADDTRREHVLQLALAAKLSGMLVATNTLGGCENGNGRLEYITLKQ